MYIEKRTKQIDNHSISNTSNFFNRKHILKLRMMISICLEMNLNTIETAN